jgi:hypothetical protein
MTTTILQEPLCLVPEKCSAFVPVTAGRDISVSGVVYNDCMEETYTVVGTEPTASSTPVIITTGPLSL